MIVSELPFRDVLLLIHSYYLVNIDLSASNKFNEKNDYPRSISNIQRNYISKV